MKKKDFEKGFPGVKYMMNFFIDGGKHFILPVTKETDRDLHADIAIGSIKGIKEDDYVVFGVDVKFVEKHPGQYPEAIRKAFFELSVDHLNTGKTSDGWGIARLFDTKNNYVAFVENIEARGRSGSRHTYIFSLHNMRKFFDDHFFDDDQKLKSDKVKVYKGSEDDGSGIEEPTLVHYVQFDLPEYLKEYGYYECYYDDAGCARSKLHGKALQKPIPTPYQEGQRDDAQKYFRTLYEYQQKARKSPEGLPEMWYRQNVRLDETLEYLAKKIAELEKKEKQLLESIMGRYEQTED